MSVYITYLQCVANIKGVSFPWMIFLPLEGGGKSFLMTNGRWDSRSCNLCACRVNELQSLYFWEGGKVIKIVWVPVVSKDASCISVKSIYNITKVFYPSFNQKNSTGILETGRRISLNDLYIFREITVFHFFCYFLFGSRFSSSWCYQFKTQGWCVIRSDNRDNLLYFYFSIIKIIGML